MRRDDDETEQAITVAVRIRPLSEKELASDQRIEWEFNERALLEENTRGRKAYNYDRVFGPETSNVDVYEGIARHVVAMALNGYNGTVFAYGQTGSGKTYSMLGTDDEPGVIPHAVRQVFDAARGCDGAGKRCTIRMSYLEVYNEEINDLLKEDGAGHNLKVLRDDPVEGAVIKDLTEIVVDSSDTVLDNVRRGEANRHYGVTNMNEHSSRSHTVFRLVIECRPDEDTLSKQAETLMTFEDDNEGAGGVQWTKLKRDQRAIVDSMVQVSYLNLVDLAGSERQHQTGASGAHLKEGGMINKSLSALALVISKLAELSERDAAAAAAGAGDGSTGVDDDVPGTPGSWARVKAAARARGTSYGSSTASDFVPYRNSKLTRLLKQSLGGNAYTSILCTMTPAPMYKEESVSTLKFGVACKTVKNTVSVNRVRDDKALVHQYRMQILELKQRIEAHDVEGARENARLLEEAKAQAEVEREKAVKLESAYSALRTIVMSPSAASVASPRVKPAGDAALQHVGRTRRKRAFSAILQSEAGGLVEGADVSVRGAGAESDIDAAGGTFGDSRRERTFFGVSDNSGGEEDASADATSFADMVATVTRAQRRRTEVHNAEVVSLTSQLMDLRSEHARVLERSRALQLERDEERKAKLALESDVAALRRSSRAQLARVRELESQLANVTKAAEDGRVLCVRLQSALEEARAATEEEKARRKCDLDVAERAAGGLRTTIGAQQSTIAAKEAELVHSNGRRYMELIAELEQEREVLLRTEETAEAAAARARDAEDRARLSECAMTSARDDLDAKRAAVEAELQKQLALSAELDARIEAVEDREAAVEAEAEACVARADTVNRRERDITAREDALVERTRQVEAKAEDVMAKLRAEERDLADKNREVRVRSAAIRVQNAWRGVLGRKMEAREAVLAMRESEAREGMAAVRRKQAEVSAAEAALKKREDTLAGSEVAVATARADYERALASVMEREVRARELDKTARRVQVEAEEASRRATMYQESLIAREGLVARQEEEIQARLREARETESGAKATFSAVSLAAVALGLTGPAAQAKAAAAAAAATTAERIATLEEREELLRREFDAVDKLRTLLVDGLQRHHVAAAASGGAAGQTVARKRMETDDEVTRLRHAVSELQTRLCVEEHACEVLRIHTRQVQGALDARVREVADLSQQLNAVATKEDTHSSRVALARRSTLAALPRATFPPSPSVEDEQRRASIAETEEAIAEIGDGDVGGAARGSESKGGAARARPKGSVARRAQAPRGFTAAEVQESWGRSLHRSSSSTADGVKRERRGVRAIPEGIPALSDEVTQF